METLNICIPTQAYGKISTGPTLYATKLITSLSKKGHKITVITPNKTLENKNINFRLIKAKNLRHASWINLSYKFKKELKNLNEKFDIIHFIDAREAVLYKNKKNVVGGIHDYQVAEAKINPLYYKKNYPNDWIKRYLYYNLTKQFEKRIKKLNVIITPSNYIKNSLIKTYNLNPNKVHTINYGLDLKFKYKPKKFNNTILFIGNNFQGKGLPVLIKAASLVIKKYPDLKFKIIGEDKKNLKFMKKLCQKLKVSNNFFFEGFIPHNQIGDYYKQADIYTTLSITEGLGIVFLEAMSYGLPVIGTKVGGINEVIEHNKNGFLINPKDYFSLANYIIKIIKDRSLKNYLIQNCKKTIKRKEFTVNNMYQKTLEVYNKILQT